MKSLYFILLFFHFSSSIAGNTKLDSIINKVDTFNNLYYENIYVHINKEIFQAGDRLWFNAYVTGVAAKLSQSKTLYCRISTATNQEILIKRFQIIDGLSGGDIELDQNLKNGYYRLTFFTKKSEVSENNFIKEILIRNYTSELDAGGSIIQNENVDNEFPIDARVYVGNDSLHIEIPSQESTDDDAFVLVSSQGELFWASEETLKLKNKISLALSELPIGMVTVTGFNKSETIIFKNSIEINNSKRSKLALKLDKSSYGSGEKTNLEILVTNKDGIPISADLSVSVYVKELNTAPKSKSIVEYMTKSENLELCFSEQNTHSFKEEQYIINGLIIHSKENLSGIHILAIDKLGEVFYETETNADGTFSINVDSTYYTSEFLVGIENNKKDRLTIQLSDTIRVNPNTSFQTPMSTSNNSVNTELDSVYLKNYLQYQFLEEVVIQDNRIEKDPIGEVKLFNFFDNVKAEKIEAEDISVMAGQSFLDVLKQVTTIHLVNAAGNVYFSRGFYNNAPALFILNNVPIGHDYRQLNLLSSHLINEITVIKNLGAVTQFGTRAQGGVVLISTKDVILNQIKPVEPLINLSNTKSIEFYELPNRFEQSQELESCAHWNDHVIVNHNGKTSVEFNNLPLSGTMVVRVEGVDMNRNFISYETSFEVK